MKKLLKYGWLVGICVLFSSGLAVADDIVPPAADDMVPIISQHNFEVTLVNNYFEYKEPDVDITVDGFMYGVIGSYTHHDKNKLMFNASLELSHGILEYDGQTRGGTPLKEDISTYILTFLLVPILRFLLIFL